MMKVSCRLVTSAARRLSLPLLALLFAQACAADGDHMVRYSVKDEFQFVRENLELAITGRGIVINNVSHIGDMLERTGKDIGAARQVYLKAEALEFCSSTISRRTMEADPHNIVFCPYIIAVYVLPEAPDTVHVAYRRPQPVGEEESRASLKAVEELLDSLAREATQ